MREDIAIEEALSHLRALIPDAGFELVREPQSGAKYSAPDFMISVRVDLLSFVVVGDVFNGDSSARLRDRVQHVRLLSESLSGSVAMIVAPYLSRERRNLIRDAGVAYVDLSGNASLRYGSLFVMVEGEGSRFNRESGSRGPFSGKASLVPELLLDQARPWGIRELAIEAGLDAGHVSRVVNSLVAGNYADKDASGKVRLLRPEELLQDWASASKPPKSRELARFSQSPSPSQVISRLAGESEGGQLNYALGNQAGAFVVAPYAAIDRVDIYVGDQAAEEWLELELELRPVERGANVVLHRLADQGDPVMRRRRLVGGVWVISDLRLYLDVHRYPRRGIEQAEHLLEEVLRPRWEMQ